MYILSILSNTALKTCKLRSIFFVIPLTVVQGKSCGGSGSGPWLFTLFIKFNSLGIANTIYTAQFWS